MPVSAVINTPYLIVYEELSQKHEVNLGSVVPLNCVTVTSQQLFVLLAQ